MNPVDLLLSIVLLCTNGATCQSYPSKEADTMMDIVNIEMCAEGEVLEELKMQSDPNAGHHYRFENKEKMKAFEVTILICGDKQS